MTEDDEAELHECKVLLSAITKRLTALEKKREWVSAKGCERVAILIRKRISELGG